jgi:hypothetical protein
MCECAPSVDGFSGSVISQSWPSSRHAAPATWNFGFAASEFCPEFALCVS